MKAVVLGADDQFRISEVAEPVSGPGEVAIRVAHAGVQYGDVLVRDGHFPIPRPFVSGFEAAGEVIAVGDAGRPDCARRFGYHEVLVRGQFPEALGDEEFDVVLDPIGGATRVANLARPAPHGRIVVYGNIATSDPVTVSANDLVARGQSLMTYNSNLAAQTHPHRLADSAAAATAMVADGPVRLDISAEHALADVGTAIANLANGVTLGKSVVRVG
jgi:NADPH:quinone reductase